MRNRILLCLLLFCLLPAAWAQVNVLTVNYDNARTNSNLTETILNHANVNSAQFGKLFTLPVDGQVYAQPLYVNAVSIPGKGVHNVVYVTTMHNSVYAFDADPAATHDPLWQVNLGPSVPAANYSTPGNPYTDISPEVGLLGTPVIDLTTNTLYVVADTFDGKSYSYVLHALDSTSGQEKNGGPAVIRASINSQGPDSQNGVVTFDPYQHLQRPGLLLLNGVVYVAFGSHGDQEPYHGWMLGYDAANVSRQVSKFNVTPSGLGGSIWQAGHGLAADELGAIYAVTANGDFDGTSNFGETVLKFAANPALALVDWFTPSNYGALNDADKDLGSYGALFLPGTDLLLAGGKGGQLYLLNRNQMGHVVAGDTQIVQSFTAVNFGIFDMALWNRSDGPIVYLQGFGEPLKAFRLSGGQFDPTPMSQGQASVQVAYGGLAVSANGGNNDTGILWVTWPNGSGAGGPGSLHAMDASDVSTELWNSDIDPNDSLGNFAKFVAPTVVNGLVYVPTFSGQVVVYGLKSAGEGTLQQVAVVNAASYQGGAVSQGELVTIFGSGIGPATPVNLQTDSAGNLLTSLGGARVFFDGQLAHLVYASSNQINAIVPYSASPGNTTKIQVEYMGQTSSTLTLPVNQATPGLFTLDASGSGQGIVLNEDMSLNAAGNPAPRGSVVQIYATGVGLTIPANDSLIQTGASGPLPVPALNLSATVGGQQATVIDAAGATGLVGAVILIRVRVPAGAPAGSAVPVVLSAGGAPSQTVTLALN